MRKSLHKKTAKECFPLTVVCLQKANFVIVNILVCTST